MNHPTGAELVVRALERNGVRFVFGIPGAKIDAVFDALIGSPIRLILCRHEQNAAFMAAAHGRLTGEPGVVLVTSGPGVCNLTTGLLTATTEGDPVIAIGGCVARSMLLKGSHQNTSNTKILEAVTKKSVSIDKAENIQEVFANAFRTSRAARKGAFFISIPCDVLSESAPDVIAEPASDIRFGTAPADEIQRAAALISGARLPVLLLGEDASSPQNAEPIRQLIRHHQIPAVATYQGAGILSRDLVPHFVGRVGLFKNQPGDRLLDAADVVVTIGYNPVEYEPEIWNARPGKSIIHIDAVPSQVHVNYRAAAEILGDIRDNIARLDEKISCKIPADSQALIARLHSEVATPSVCHSAADGKIHPLAFIEAFRAFVSDDDLIMCDIGTVYIWMARHFLVHRPRQLFFSNGQQTLGVALPWAIAAKLTCPEKRIFSLSGDGGFLFSSMELETAVREKTPFVHFIWTDGTYNMVLEQEILKYGRTSGVDLGRIDVSAYATAFGARGLRLTSMENFSSILDEAARSEVPVLIDVPIDYSENQNLFITVKDDAGN